MNRREFLKSLLAAAAGLGLVKLEAGHGKRTPRASTSSLYMPIVMQQPANVTLQGRVIHLHTTSVTNWDFKADHYYGKTRTSNVVGVDQSVIDAMVDRGVTELLGLQSNALAEAWRRLIPNYSAGKLVAVKINFNNSAQYTCGTTTDRIDAIAQPINAVVRGLKLRGVRDQDIVVYDAIRSFSDRVYQELIYLNIQLHDANGCQGHPTTWNSADPNAMVHFSPPDGDPPTVRLSDSLINADYLINIPILKGHSLAGVTLGFKNHFGSTNNPSGMHKYVSRSYPLIDQYNALVDLYSNPHIRDKTVLTIGDGIYGSREHQSAPPQPWQTFNNQSPCSLFFAADPVAIDCVMHDLLKAERGSNQPETSNAYLKLAEKAGLGVFESGNPWQTPYGRGYRKITYKRIEI